MLKHIQTDREGNQAHIQALSLPRLSSYRRFFGVDNEQALRIYQWNDELSAALFLTIRQLEVLLRNQFHRALSLRYGTTGSHGSRDWYAYVNLTPKSQDSIKNITHHKKKKSPSSPDDVISRLTFGFWPHLLDLAKDAQGQPIDWGSTLLDVLPGHRQRQATYWSQRKYQDMLFARLDLCNEIRNRLAHHEPIWKLGPLMHEGRPRKGKPLTEQLPAPSTPDEALARLRLLYDRMTELLRWLSPASVRQYLHSPLHLRCLNLLQPETLQAYRSGNQLAEINLSTINTMRTLRKTLRYAARHQQPILLKDGQYILGHITCHKTTTSLP